MFTPQATSNSQFASEESVSSIPSEFSFERKDSFLPDSRLSKSISDKDLIKELISENFQLKSTISEQQKLIEELQAKLNTANFKLPKDEQVNPNTSLKLEVQSTEALVIPERSHRRKISSEISNSHQSPAISENSFENTFSNGTFTNSITSNSVNGSTGNISNHIQNLKKEDTKLTKSPISRENSNYSVSSAARSSIYSNDSIPPVQRPPSSPYRARIRIPTPKQPSSPSVTEIPEDPRTHSTLTITSSAQSVSISRPTSPPVIRPISPKQSKHIIDEELNIIADNNSNLDDVMSNSSSSIVTANVSSSNSLGSHNIKNLTINPINPPNVTSNDNQFLESPAIVKRENLSANYHLNNNNAIPLQTPKDQSSARFAQLSSPASRNITPQHVKSPRSAATVLASPLQTANIFNSPMPSAFQPSPAPSVAASSFGGPFSNAASAKIQTKMDSTVQPEDITSPTTNRKQNSGEKNIPLFIQPQDFHTIVIDVKSTISTFLLKRNDEPAVVIVVRDRNSRKEMWRIKKTYTQILEFDSNIRPMVDSFSLPPLPDKQLFYSTSPSKVDSRRAGLHDFFNTLFVITHIPQFVLLKICRFLSLDFINPLDDFKSGAKKEGFLIRRSKGLGNNWKVRWCQVDGPSLDIFEQPGGSVVEMVRLTGSQIGRQSNNDTVADEKGYKHAFLIMELKRNSSYTKHIFCCETDEERDSWIDNLIEAMNTDNGAHKRQNSSASTLSKASTEDISISTQSIPHPKLHSSATLNSPRDLVSQANENKEDTSKNKKRGFFPFRAKNTTNDDHELTKTSDSVSATQNILDELHLEEMRNAIFGREIVQVFEFSHHECYGKDIPSIVYRCIDFLLKTGAIFEEGIFRLSGSATMIKQLKEQFDTEYDVNLLALVPCPDIHTVAGLLKLYLREIPSPVLSTKYYPLFKQYAAESKSPRQLALYYRELIKEVPAPNLNLCFAIFKFLNEIIENDKSNLMNLRNVCIVFSPTLNISVNVLSPLISDYDCIFNGKDPIDDNKREVLDIKIPGF